MDPRWLMPLLATLFGLLAAQKAWRSRNLRGATRTWAILASVFAAVSLWLHLGA